MPPPRVQTIPERFGLTKTTSLVGLPPTPGPTGVNDVGAPDVADILSKLRLGTSLKSADYSIEFEGINQLTLGVDCKSYKFVVTPKLTVNDVACVGTGYNNLYIFIFFRVSARIEWNIVATTPRNEKKKANIATEFSIEWPKKELIILLLEPTKLKWLKTLMHAESAAKAIEWLSNLPLVLRMYDAVNEQITDYCNGSLDLEKMLRDIYNSELQNMRCETTQQCA